MASGNCIKKSDVDLALEHLPSEIHDLFQATIERSLCKFHRMMGAEFMTTVAVDTCRIVDGRKGVHRDRIDRTV